ncbi:hypothetical protein SRABI106_02327 [Rahnella aquatilis]|nr:hypothetical protein SRABI106_02327 [Rahnella aquatilis]
MILIRADRTGYAQPFKRLLRTDTQIRIAFHHCRHGGHADRIRRRDGQALHAERGGDIVQVCAGGISQHHRLRRLVHPLTQDHFAVSVLLQQLHNGFRLQGQRADDSGLLVFGVQGDQRSFALRQEDFVIQHLHHVGGG